MVLLLMAVLPKEGQEVLHALEVDEEHLAEDGGLQLFLVAKLGLVLHPALSDDEATAGHLLEVRVLALRLLEDSGLVVAVLEGVDPQQLLICGFGFEAEHQ